MTSSVQSTDLGQVQPKGRVPRRMPTLGRVELAERGAALLVALLSLAVVVTCSASVRPPEPPAPTAPPMVTGVASGGSSSERMAPQPLPVAEQPSVGSPEPSAPEPLRDFYTALSALAAGRREHHVRISWLGDSHTTADLWTHKVRQRLQAKFGVGGPGFVHLGLKGFRHSQVKTETQGKWQRVPAQPARTQPYADGIFGLGGVRAVPQQNALAKAHPYQSALVGEASWRIYYRLPPGSSFVVTLGEHSQVVKATPHSAHALQVLTFDAAPQAELVVRQASGSPEFFGLSVEGKQAGVILDTLGIDGARARTPLAWKEGPWEQELARRGADLVVLAYGTNEVFEAYPATKYRQHFVDLMTRVHRALPNVACLIIGPTDALQGDGSPHPRVLEISRVQQAVADELSCGYVGAHELMGGEGSYAEWQSSKPQLAGQDGVHLTVRGYQELGELTADYLMTQYQKWLDSGAGQ